ncbi:MAG: hypothetical protein OEW09_04760 [Anaerolineae bacterium]|nr:hypothetical protein [Anaerolineae bacterium]
MNPIERMMQAEIDELQAENDKLRAGILETLACAEVALENVLSEIKRVMTTTAPEEEKET